MKKTKLTLAIAAIALSSTSLVQADNYNARNTGMGGAGVASSNYDAAGGYNPALLTAFEKDDDVSLVIPSVTAEVSDKDDVIDTLDNISDHYDALSLAIDFADAAGAAASKDQILAGLKKVSMKPVRADVSGAISLAIPGETFSYALDVRGYADIGVLAMYDDTDEALIDLAIGTGDSSVLDNTGSAAIAIGAVVTEIALSAAYEFEGEHNWSIGVTPKYQNVETILYAATANNFDSNDFDADQFTVEDSNFNMDIGAAYFVDEKTTVGLVAKDLIANDYKTIASGTAFADNFEIKPYATLGVAHDTGTFAVTIEADLSKRAGYTTLGGSQFARFGAEADAFGWAQLRIGYRHDMKDVTSDVATLGLGFSPWNIFHVNVVGMVGDDDTYGGSAEIKFTF